MWKSESKYHFFARIHSMHLSQTVQLKIWMQLIAFVPNSLDNTLKSYIITIKVIILLFSRVLTNFQDGTFVTLNEVRIPFLQEDPKTEFIINIIQQVYISSIGISALLAIGAWLQWPIIQWKLTSSLSFLHSFSFL